MRNNYKYTEDYKLEDLKYLIDNIPYPVWIKGSDGIYKYVNKQYAEITNMVPEDIIGKSDYDIRDEETSQLFYQKIEKYWIMRKLYFIGKSLLI